MISPGAHQSAGSLPGFLHFAVCSFAEGLQELVPVLQVVLVVVSLHGLLFHGHLTRSMFIGGDCPDRRPGVWRKTGRTVHAEHLLLVAAYLRRQRCLHGIEAPGFSSRAAQAPSRRKCGNEFRPNTSRCWTRRRRPSLRACRAPHPFALLTLTSSTPGDERSADRRRTRHTTGRCLALRGGAWFVIPGACNTITWDFVTVLKPLPANCFLFFLLLEALNSNLHL